MLVLEAYRGLRVLRRRYFFSSFFRGYRVTECLDCFACSETSAKYPGYIHPGKSQESRKTCFGSLPLTVPVLEAALLRGYHKPHDPV